LNDLSGSIQVDFRSDEPIYLQIARQIEQLVANGTLKKGDQLPTVRELATELRINFNTVSRAYRILDEAALISTQRGRGTYIWEKPTETPSRRLRQEDLAHLTQRYLQDAVRLGFTPDEVKTAFLTELHAKQSGKDPPPAQGGDPTL
jgi:GntR family transcriptional regulator